MFESISPGIYEILWEMNIYNLLRAQRFQFITKIFHNVIINYYIFYYHFLLKSQFFNSNLLILLHCRIVILLP